MHGGGIKTVTTIGRDFKALFDVSRLVSRVGFGPHTGVDRVELAYLEWCLSTEPELFGVCRVGGGFALMDRSGLSKIHARIVGLEDWGSRDLRGLVGIKTSILRSRAESDVRRFALEFNRAPVFSTQLSDLIYLNTGHSNLKQDSVFAISTQTLSMCVFLHDVIPLEYPEFQTPEAVANFRSKISVIEELTPLVIFNSEDTKLRSTRYLPNIERSVVSHLGVDTPTLEKEVLSRNRPYFVTIGTIEPRKNHKLLMNVWTDMSDDKNIKQVPHLHIVGRRGWKNEDVFSDLDRSKVSGTIFEHSNLDDKGMWSLLRGARALLFPSLAEGFGLPSLEAAALGVPVICGDLAIHRELLGNYPVYVDLRDPYLWKKAILEHMQATDRSQRPGPHIPSWDEHFARVNKAITEER